MSPTKAVTKATKPLASAGLLPSISRFTPFNPSVLTIGSTAAASVDAFWAASATSGAIVVSSKAFTDNNTDAPAACAAPTNVVNAGDASAVVSSAHSPAVSAMDPFAETHTPE